MIIVVAVIIIIIVVGVIIVVGGVVAAFLLRPQEPLGLTASHLCDSGCGEVLSFREMADRKIEQASPFFPSQCRPLFVTNRLANSQLSLLPQHPSYIRDHWCHSSTTTMTRYTVTFKGIFYLFLSLSLFVVVDDVFIFQ